MFGGIQRLRTRAKALYQFFNLSEWKRFLRFVDYATYLNVADLIFYTCGMSLF